MADFIQHKGWIRSGKVGLFLLGLLLVPCIFNGSVAYASIGQQTAATQTSLSANAENSRLGTTATLTAHVSGLDGSEISDGVVEFRSLNRRLGSATVDSQGNATLITGNLPVGNTQIVAVYQGNLEHSASVSPSAMVDSSPSTVPGYTVSSDPTSLTIPVGATGTSTITLTGVNGFDSYVSLSCNGLPAGLTCAFSPNYVLVSCTAGSGGSENCPSVNSIMQIQTYAASGTKTASNAGGKKNLPFYAFIVPSLFGFAGLSMRKKRSAWNKWLLLLLVAGTMSLTGCNVRYNYLNHGPTPNNGSIVGTYTVTIDAASATGSLITKPLTPAQIVVQVTSAN